MITALKYLALAASFAAGCLIIGGLAMLFGLKPRQRPPGEDDATR